MGKITHSPDAKEKAVLITQMDMLLGKREVVVAGRATTAADGKR